jgi:hypothetical protein
MSRDLGFRVLDLHKLFILPIAEVSEAALPRSRPNWDTQTLFEATTPTVSLPGSSEVACARLQDKTPTAVVSTVVA